LMQNPEVVSVIFAPLFCMGYFHAPVKRQLITISVTIGIIMLVLQIRFLQQPWRGIIDAGVVLGLVWGLVTLCFFSYQAIKLKQFDYPHEVPDKN